MAARNFLLSRKVPSGSKDQLVARMYYFFSFLDGLYFLLMGCMLQQI